LGKRFGTRTPAVAAAIREADPAAVATAVADGGSFAVAVPAPAKVRITAEDVIVTQVPVAGWEVATAGGETVALDLTVTPALRAEGLAREVIRRVQQARKSDGLAVTDRIMLRWSAPITAGDSDAAGGSGGELASALATHGEKIAAEVLAVSLESVPSPEAGVPLAGDGTPGQWSEHDDADFGLRFWIRRQALSRLLLGLAGTAGGAACLLSLRD
jgi:isoleucyl-tRNA synthetase